MRLGLAVLALIAILMGLAVDREVTCGGGGGLSKQAAKTYC